MRFLTAGESHGLALVGILEGMVAGVPLTEDDIATDLRRRQGGYGRGGRMDIERDRARVLSGVRYGRTLGSPIALIIENRDAPNWGPVMRTEPVEDPVDPLTCPRPGHADFAGAVKYGHTDLRNVIERASARETAMRVALGAIGRRFLECLGMRVFSRVIAIGEVHSICEDEWNIETVEYSPVRCGDPAAEKEMIAAIDTARAEGDTLGGVFEISAHGLPVGLGSHVHWDRRLDASIAAALMSIPGIKAVESGDGFSMAGRPGSLVHDPFLGRGVPEGGGVSRPSNHAGGIEGGITNGMPLRWRAAMKPIPTLGEPLPSVDLRTGDPFVAAPERSDVCAVPSASVVGEAVVALELAEAVMQKYGGDSLDEVLTRWPASKTEANGR